MPILCQIIRVLILAVFASAAFANDAHQRDDFERAGLLVGKPPLLASDASGGVAVGCAAAQAFDENCASGAAAGIAQLWTGEEVSTDLLPIESATSG